MTATDDLTTAWASLEAAMLGEPDYDDEPPELALTDRDAANRHLGHIRRLEREFAADTEMAQATIARAQAWLEARTVEIEQRIAYHASVLDRYHRACFSLDDRLVTINVPNGALHLRAQQPEWEFTDEFAAWANRNRPDLLRTPKPSPPVTRAVDAVAAKQALTRKDEKGKRVLAYGVLDDGVVPPGFTVTERDRAFDYDLASEE